MLSSDRAAVQFQGPYVDDHRGICPAGARTSPARGRIRTELIGTDDPGRWDAVVAEFPDADVYDLAGFHHASSVGGGGEPWLVVARGDGGQAAIPMLVRQVPDHPGTLDVTSAYGYPGVLLQGSSDARRECLRAAVAAIQDAWAPVSLLIRMSPFRDETPALRSIARVRHVGRTVAVDLQRPDAEIWASTRSLHRRRYRQADRLGPELFVDDQCAGLDRFHELYEETMHRVGAAPRYYLGRPHLDVLSSGLDTRFRLFHASLDGQIESSAIMLDSGRVVHYHLGGSSARGLGLGLARWLLEQVRRWAGEADRDWYHLGGGLGAADDGLYWFKRGFSGTDLCFSVAELVLDETRYAEMTAERQHHRADFFPGYRSPCS